MSESHFLELVGQEAQKPTFVYELMGLVVLGIVSVETVLYVIKLQGQKISDDLLKSMNSGLPGAPDVNKPWMKRGN